MAPLLLLCAQSSYLCCRTCIHILWNPTRNCHEGNGKSLVTYKHTTTSLNLIIYNPETKATVTIEDITDGMGTGNKVTHITVSGDGKTLYVGAYGINHISIYDVESGEKTKQFVTYSTQTEGVTFYDGYLYAGCYGACGILKIDLDALSVTPLFTL